MKGLDGVENFMRIVECGERVWFWKDQSIERSFRYEGCIISVMYISRVYSSNPHFCTSEDRFIKVTGKLPEKFSVITEKVTIILENNE